MNNIPIALSILLNVVILYLTIKNNSKMATKLEAIEALIQGINDDTNNIAADLERIAGGMTGGLTADEADAVIADLQAAADRLKSVADQNPEPVDPDPAG